MRVYFLTGLILLSNICLQAQSKSPAAINYIESYKVLAIREMELKGIPASITLAQAIHESAAGTSQLAVQANNHFGVKCASNWTGKKYYRNNNPRNNCFRNYESVEDAYKDRSRFLSTNKKYKFLFQYKTWEYQKWAYGLQRSGYAASNSYANHLLSIINLYDLHQYDRKDSSYIKPGKITDGVHEPEIHKVKSGESLYIIAKRYRTDVATIKQNNNLKSNLIKPGQKLIIEK